MASNSDDFNKVLPYGPWTPKDGGNPRIETDYPYVRAEVDVNGKVVAVHADPNQPELSSEVTFNHDGTYTTREVNDKYKGVTTSLNHLSLGYNSGGKSNQVDGHIFENGESTSFRQVTGDKGGSVGGNEYYGVSGKKIGGTQEGSFENHSEGNILKTTKGDIHTQHDGNYFHSSNGHNITSTTGVKYDMVDGEYGVHVQNGGNMSVRVEDGNLDFHSGDKFLANSAGTMEIKSTQALSINSSSTGSIKTSEGLTIESSQTITLKVGSSTIEISAGTITITSGAINFVQG